MHTYMRVRVGLYAHAFALGTGLDGDGDTGCRHYIFLRQNKLASEPGLSPNIPSATNIFVTRCMQLDFFKSISSIIFDVCTLLYYDVFAIIRATPDDSNRLDLRVTLMEY